MTEQMTKQTTCNKCGATETKTGNGATTFAPKNWLTLYGRGKSYHFCEPCANVLIEWVME